MTTRDRHHDRVQIFFRICFLRGLQFAPIFLYKSPIVYRANNDQSAHNSILKGHNLQYGTFKQELVSVSVKITSILSRSDVFVAFIVNLNKIFCDIYKPDVLEKNHKSCDNKNENLCNNTSSNFPARYFFNTS
jgi:hypothetical protein